jgi:hypothetical protein
MGINKTRSILPFDKPTLIDRLEGARLKLHEPHPAGVALQFDRPWEGRFSGYITVLHDSDRYRMYYRGLSKDGADYPTNITAEPSRRCTPREMPRPWRPFSMPTP